MKKIGGGARFVDTNGKCQSGERAIRKRGCPNYVVGAKSQIKHGISLPAPDGAFDEAHQIANLQNNFSRGNGDEGFRLRS
jgi:hypothetical protein